MKGLSLSGDCPFLDSLRSPLVSPDSNAISLCFFQACSLIASAVFAIFAIYQFASSVFSNHYGPFKIKYAFGSPFKLQSVGILQIIKLYLITIHMLLVVLSIGERATNADFALLVLVVLPFQVVEPTRSVVCSASTSLYWLYKSVFTGVIMWQKEMYSNAMTLTVEVCLFVSSLLIFTLESWFYRPSRELKQHYDLNGWHVATVHNFWSELTFFWLDATISKIYETQRIDVDETPPLHVDQQCQYTFGELKQRWTEAAETNSNKKKTSLLGIYLSIHRRQFVAMLILDLLAVVCNLTQAFLLQQLLLYTGESNTRPVVVGFSIATGIFACAVGKFTSLNRFAALHFKIRTQTYSSLGTFVYQKALSLSSESRKFKNTGEIINNLAVDVNKIALVAQYSFALNFPIRITIALVAIYRLLGVAAFFGFLTALVMVPLTSTVSASISSLIKRNMKIRDERLKLTSEILQSIKSIKLYAWEQPMLARLFKIRNESELSMARKVGIYNAISMFLWNTIPFAISVTCLIAFVKLTHLVLVPAVIFPALSLFDLLTDPISQLPDAIVAILEARVSFNRLYEFFNLPDCDSRVVKTKNVKGKDEISVSTSDATFNWSKDAVALQNINFTARQGQLTCIVGKVGSGKSALLKALLGDLQQTSGVVNVNGTVAYCAQQPWIQNATVKANILFGCKLDETYYNKVVKACQLISDLNILPDGDQTVVGEKGISLSGGQKARISLARAVYARADVILLDDVLSAVDAHVGKSIINEVLSSATGLLADKTVILATNAINVLQFSQEVYLIKNGTIAERGSWDQIKHDNSELAKLINEHSRKVEEHAEEEEEEVKVAEIVAPPLNAVKAPAELRTVQEQEKGAKGTVKFDVYYQYFKACNFPMILLYILIYGGNVFCTIAANYILKNWSEHNLEHDGNSQVVYYLSLYAAVGISGAACTLFAALIMWCYCILRGSKHFHDEMAKAVLRSPMQFFETTPLGRILNRFADDMNVIDQQLIWSILAVIDFGLLTVGLLGEVVYNLPMMGIVVVILVLVFNRIRVYFIASARELKRLLSACRSPLFSHLSESINGVDTIKAFDQEDKFKQDNNRITNTFIRVQYTTLCASRWLSMRLQTISAVIVYSSALFILSTVGTKHQISAGMAGFILINALSITGGLNMIVRGWADIEARSVSLERVIEYANLKPEAAEIVVDNRPPPHWPSHGAIKFENYYTKYRDNFDYVLKNINLDIKPGEKIGVVGRTGAGKSTLTMALFRIIEATSGGVAIDGIQTNAIGLFDLRSHLNIIPQDSNTVEGTVRENLDPLGKHDDARLWQVLQLAHLKAHVEQLTTTSFSPDGSECQCHGLDAMVFEGGSNLSAGQRQLLSLARALLNESTTLVLDEATASIDVETDRVVQNTIRSEFKDKTIVTIAHRLETIMDSDRVVVLEKGEVREFDTPAQLLKDTNSMFYSLCAKGGVLKN
ncbi:uncharacterized protein LODBEIA_P22020 [Lodderomyces beijingensis]|uniref:Uncharacterized protein n=1 Tax=Lodderomyces beijingensis TaxID=1775926 RepID=A0ABP0ZIL3_9ASCO